MATKKPPIARGIFKKIKDDKIFIIKAVDGFEPTIKSFCRPVPYHLAIPPPTYNIVT